MERKTVYVQRWETTCLGVVSRNVGYTVHPSVEEARSFIRRHVRAIYVEPQSFDCMRPSGELRTEYIGNEEIYADLISCGDFVLLAF